MDKFDYELGNMCLSELKQRIKELTKENKNIRILLESFKSKIVESTNCIAKGKLTEKEKELLQTSIVPLNLDTLKVMNREDLIVSFLIRETFLYQKADEFQESIKHNDRIVFKNQRAEIVKIRNYLIDTSPIYRENLNLKAQKKELKEIINSLQIELKIIKAKYGLPIVES